MADATVILPDGTISRDLGWVDTGYESHAGEETTSSQYPEPGFISSEEYVDPGLEINAMFGESFAEMRGRSSRRRGDGEPEDQEIGGGDDKAS